LSDSKENQIKPNESAGSTDASRKGRLVILSGPSGVGKTTILKELHAICPLPLEESVSATTRAQRPGETEGVSYRYMTKDQFQVHIANDDFIEYTEVFSRGDLYGTLREPVLTGISQGKWIILELDVVGAFKVLKIHPDAITIFIHPGSLEELEKRLRGRGTETEEALKRRLEVADGELAASEKYQHIVFNQSVQQTATEISSLLQQAENH
jgi:guanylate kinase